MSSLYFFSFTSLICYKIYWICKYLHVRNKKLNNYTSQNANGGLDAPLLFFEDKNILWEADRYWVTPMSV